MTIKMTLGLCAFGATIGFASMASAGAIDSACMKAGRSNSSATCGCIQQVADMTLSNRDQRRAASFFRDPDRAQVVRMSESKSDNDFWARYKKFASTAEGYCSQ
ncbi:hypothetical protein DT23_11430 [Thioclava indica]|uniref:Arginine transporter n=2 Tax=Thioclava indica TaxID=1353528 RepID=A0A074KHC9_9RHOB|nr:hypothetical protein DT23_11430 [Thioclava indica]